MKAKKKSQEEAAKKLALLAETYAKAESAKQKPTRADVQGKVVDDSLMEQGYARVVERLDQLIQQGGDPPPGPFACDIQGKIVYCYTLQDCIAVGGTPRRPPPTRN